MKNDIVSEYVKYTFSDDEKAEMASDMAQKVTELSAAEDEKKAIMSDFKSRIDGLQAQVNLIATKLNNGYEMRNMDCEKVPVFDLREWHMVRCDNGETARVRSMTADDLQMGLELEEA